MKHYETPFLEPHEVQPTFFNSLTDDERAFYGPIFASLRKSNNQWLALAVHNYKQYGVMPETTNRNTFMQTLFEAIIEAEKCAAFDAAVAEMGDYHKAELDDLSVRLKRWFHDRFNLSFLKH